MSELTKTVVFVVVGVLLFCAAVALYLTNQSQLNFQQAEDMIGKPLFEEFDALDVAGLEIVKYDEETGKGIPFEVARLDGIWSIPSHDNYPADAKDQVTNAATSMMDIEVLGVASDNMGDHELYGVVDPDPKTLKPGAVGVGTRVVMKDKDEKLLVAMVIGKEVEGAPGQHYVCRIGQAPVYTAAVDPGSLSTKFEDWIEDDLLKINTWDIQQMQIRDYTVDNDGTPNLRDLLVLDYDDTEDPKWKMVRNQGFVGDELTDIEMTEDEQLNTDALGTMISSLDDLKIVDVRRKPAGLSANLKATGSFAGDAETQLSLAARGFFLSPTNQGLELLSQNGDVRYIMKDGVEYVLRFGGIAHGTTTEKADEKSDEETAEQGEEKAEEETSGENRYIFVMAQFNPDAIPKPVKEGAPEQEPADDASADEKPAEGDSAEEHAHDHEEGEEHAHDHEEHDHEAGEEASAAEKPADDDAEEGDAADGDAAEDEAAEGDAAEGDDADEHAHEHEEGEEHAHDHEGHDHAHEDGHDHAHEEAADKDAEKDAAEEPATEEDPAAAERDRQYQMEMDEYEEKIAKGQKTVDELNARFADWYYVISNDVYEKVHLGRDKIVKQKTTEEDAAKTGGHDHSHAGHDHSHGPDGGHDHAEEDESSLETFNRLRQQGVEGQ